MRATRARRRARLPGVARPVGAALLLTLAPLAPTAPTAAADPGYPTEQDVRRASDAAAAAATDAAGVQAALDAAADRAAAAEVALSIAAEDYDSAALELGRRERVARQAEATATAARSRLAVARRDVGRLAAQTYRDGGPLAPLAAVLSPSGPQDVVDRVDLTRSVADHRQGVVRRMDAARVVTTLLDRQAADAVADARRATDALAAARRAAEERAAAARAVQAETAARQAVLLDRLAGLRRTTVALERQRQAGIAAAREAERERRERAREARAPRHRQDGGRGSAGGASSGGGGADDRMPAVPPGPPATGGSAGSTGGGAAAVAWARRQVGLPYLWGGDGPDSYDCSGLVMRAWERSGVALPHSSRAQYRQVAKIPYSRLRPGDLLFFATDTGDPGTIHHVAMYAGGGLMAEAPATGLRVRVVPVRHRGEMPWAGRP